MDFNISLMASKSIESAERPMVDADGTLDAIFETYDIPLEVLNLFSEPRLQKRMERIDAAISDVAIWGFALASVIFSVVIRHHL